MSELALKLIREAKEKKSKFLDLGNCGLTELPKELFELEDLEELNLGWFFYDKNGKLRESKTRGNWNKLSKNAQSLSKLSQLIHLYLGDNQITDIRFLEKLTQLQTLDLSSNQITDYSFLEKLTQLQTLDLSSNQITDLRFLEKLTQLQTLYLSSNQITDLRPILSLIKKGIPLSLEQFDFSQKINLYGNPIKNPPLEIVRKGNQAIIEYFEERKEQGSSKLYEAKFLILGEGGAGKTTLARKLINENAEMPDENETTEGIDIHHLDFKMKNGKDFRVNIWDFGGQEIYHATHQFFLTKRSLYALVTDNRKEDTDFKYWLETVDLLTEKCPLFIVQNERAERTKNLDEKGIKGSYDNLKANFTANLKTNKGLDKIMEALQFHIQDLPHIGDEWPLHWLEIRKALEKLEEDGKAYISLEKYLEVCAEYKIPERKRALFLSQYLHDLGVFLHFQEDDLLRKTVILKNDWATDAVYKILDSKTIKDKKKGRFNESDLKALWKESDYMDMKLELLALMKKFEMCYELPDTQKRTWLAPQLLPPSQPDAHVWEDSDNLVLRYKYRFMPKGLLNRFMVRQHDLIKNVDLAWRNGVVLELQNTKAEVVELYGRSEIRIRIKGDLCRDLMTIIVRDFERLHGRFENIKVQKLIPCNCRECSDLSEKEKYYFRFEALRKAELKGLTHVPCQDSWEKANVNQMIYGTFFADKIDELRHIHVRFEPTYESKTDEPMPFSKSEIETDIREGNFREAIDKLDACLKGRELGKDIIQLAGRFSDLESQKQAGTVSNDNANVEQNKIISALTKLAETL